MVDGGGWALGSLESQKFQSLFVADVMGQLGTSIVNVAPPDLNYGVDVLRTKAQEAHFDLVSSNLKRKSTGQPVFAPYVVREVRGLRLAFLGVMNENEPLAPLTPDGDDLMAEDARATIEALLPEVRAKADFVVVFSHITQRRTRQLVDEVDGIDIAINGGDGFMNQKATEVGNDSTGMSLVLEAGQQGKYVGALKMVVSEHGKLLRYTHQMHTLDNNVRQDSTIVASIEQFKTDLREVRKREAVEQVVGSSPSSPAAPQEKFVGALVCARCHPSAYDAWKESVHAKSMQSLERKAMENSAECLKCHVTGFNQPNGYPNVQSELGAVSCEQCHGYGTQHGSKDFVARPASQSCVACHDTENSPKFDYASYWARIAHH